MNRKMRLLLTIIMFIILLHTAYSITTFIIQETEKISLEADATDPDSDELLTTYTPPLNEKGEWQTGYGDAGEYKATVTISDGVTNDSKDVLIIVNKKKEPPKIDSVKPEQDILSIKETESINFSISASDLNKDRLSYKWFLDDEKVKDGQEFTYGTTYDDAGNHEISVVVSDGTNSIRKKWRVDVNNVDRAPTFEKLENKGIHENQEITIILNANDLDNDEIIYSASNMPEGAEIDDNVFTWKPSFDTVKTEGFFDRVIDKFIVLSKDFHIQFIVASKDEKITQNVIVTVKDVNSAPVIEDMEPITINEGETLKIVPNAYDLDGDKVSLSYSGFINTDTFKSGFDDAGTYHIKVTASDGLLETSKFVQINIEQTNRVPLFGKISQTKAREDDNIAVLLEAHDPDGDEITYSIDNPPEDSSLKGNIFLWTPGFNTANKGEIKKFDLVFAANDGTTETRQIAKIEIADKNRAPKIINSTKSIVAKVNKPVLMFVKAVDEDEDGLIYTWEFGIFERYKATSTHQRIFTTTGTKTVKVIVSDGIDEVEQVINVNVA